MREHRCMRKHRYLRLRWPTGCFGFCLPWIFTWWALRLRIVGTRAAQAGACPGRLTKVCSREGGPTYWLHPDFWSWAPEPTSGYKMRDIIYYAVGVPPPAARLPEETF